MYKIMLPALLLVLLLGCPKVSKTTTNKQVINVKTQHVVVLHNTSIITGIDCQDNFYFVDISLLTDSFTIHVGCPKGGK